MKKSRRIFTAEFRAKIAIVSINNNKTLSALAQIFPIHTHLIIHR